jgi:hypothetical protein
MNIKRIKLNLKDLDKENFETVVRAVYELPEPGSDVSDQLPFSPAKHEIGHLCGALCMGRIWSPASRRTARLAICNLVNMAVRETWACMNCCSLAVVANALS